MKCKKINLEEKFSKFNEVWTPKVIAEMNDFQFKLVKIKDHFVNKILIVKLCNLFILMLFLVIFKVS